jgi:RHS repeat-associated protein
VRCAASCNAHQFWSYQYTYDAEGNITAVSGNGTATYVYNALNQRVQTVANSSTTGFVFNAAGQRVSEWTWNGTTYAQTKGKYYWGAEPVAYYASGATHFEHQDWLGTERMRTTYNGGVENSYTSLPFGDAQTPTTNGTDANHFAALDHDYETDTDHAQFRQYSNAQGRWLSPDAYAGSYRLRNPQSFNRYTYASNLPLSAIDPSGNDPCDGGGPVEAAKRASRGAHAEDDNPCLPPTTGGPPEGPIPPDSCNDPTVSSCTTGTPPPDPNPDPDPIIPPVPHPAPPGAGTAPSNTTQQQTQHFWQKPGCGSAIGETALGVAGSAIEVGAVVYVGPTLVATATAEVAGDAAVSGAALGEAGLNLAHVGTAVGMMLAAPFTLAAHGIVGIAGSCF